LAPTAVIWNNIAFSLAEQDVQLERASQYSDAAINAVETQLRDVNLDNLRPQDLFTANLLYNIWDTKGWVEFKRGNLDGAEKFIRASWDAKGNGDIALHLGDIAAKRGNKEDAIRYYLFALTGQSPSMEARARLSALGVSGDLDGQITKADAELKAMRAHKLDASGKGTGDFFVLASPTKNEQVKFVSGNTEIKSLAEIVKAAALGIAFPGPSSVRALRRGTVTCGTVATPPLAKGKAQSKKPAKPGAVRPVDTNDVPAAKPELLPGPCSVELLPSDLVRSIE
jgi:tetratricopeptide (TPR) repeat protein